MLKSGIVCSMIVLKLWLVLSNVKKALRICSEHGPRSSTVGEGGEPSGEADISRSASCCGKVCAADRGGGDGRGCFKSAAAAAVAASVVPGDTPVLRDKGCVAGGGGGMLAVVGLTMALGGKGGQARGGRNRRGICL